MSRVVAVVLTVLAGAAVAATVVLRPTSTPALAPGLAALSNPELAGFLPAAEDFPPGWEVKQSSASTPDIFGYHAGTQSVDSYDPPDCFALLQQAWSIDGFAAARVVGNPADTDIFSTSLGVRLEISRNFHTAVLDDQQALVSRCGQFTEDASDHVGHTNVTVIEDAPTRLRYSVTSSVDGEPAEKTQSDYYSFAALDGLLVTGHASNGQQAVLDALFTQTTDQVASP